MSRKIECEECYSQMKGEEGVDYCLECEDWRYFYYAD